MEAASRHTTTSIIGARLRKARKAKGLTQEQAATPQFTKGYVSALERGAVRPSLKALEYFASRLALPLSYFISGIEINAGQEEGLLPEPDIEALQEDLDYQYNYARMMIRNQDPENIEQALKAIEAAERSAAPYIAGLPPRLRYRPHFLRGLAFMRRSEMRRALPEMERALCEAEGDEIAAATVRNMFGVAHYLLQQPSTALHFHLRCLYAVQSGAVKDLSLKLSILHNLANDYWALNDVSKAIEVYKRALSLVEDIDGLDRQASTFWALGMAYRAANDSPQAKLYSTRALNIYEALHDMSRAASICVHLAEIFTNEERYEDAQQMLEKAEAMLEKANDPVLLSTVHADYAELNRRRGALGEAAWHIEKSIALINMVVAAAEGNDDGTGVEKSVQKSAHSIPSYPPINITRARVEALKIAAVIAEEQSRAEEADSLFAEAQQLVLATGLAELAHTVAFVYAEVLGTRGDFAGAARQYRIAAQSVSNQARVR